MRSVTKIILVRHGQSLGNATGQFLGHTDIDLSELGYKQAECTAEHLSSEHIDVIYSSDLMRALNTALPHAKIRDLSVITDPAFREVFVGDWEGMFTTDIKEKYPYEYEQSWKHEFGTFTFPGGESTQGAATRFLARLEQVASDNLGKTILVAAHAAVIRASYARLLELRPECVAEGLPFPSNASYSIVEFDKDKLIPIKYSCDEHLASVGITKVGF